MEINVSNKTAAVLVLVYLILVVTIAVGWVLNLVALIHAAGLSGLVVARAVGIFVPPLGAVLGYFF